VGRVAFSPQGTFLGESATRNGPGASKVGLNSRIEGGKSDPTIRTDSFKILDEKKNRLLANPVGLLGASGRGLGGRRETLQPISSRFP